MFKEAFIADSRTADRIFRVQSAGLLREEYETRVDRLERSMFDRIKVSPQAPMHELALEPLLDFSASLTSMLIEGVRESARDSVYALERLLGRTLGTAGQLEDHAFSASLRERSTFGAEVAQRDMTGRLVGHVFASIVSGTPPGTPKERAAHVGEVLNASWWRVQRLARTETSLAYNAVRVEALKALRPAFPDLRQRWTERLDDPEAESASDSAEMHGQVVGIGQQFFLPAGAGRWSHPPNRPNDSAIVTPWQPGWGVVAWSWAGQKIWHQ